MIRPLSIVMSLALLAACGPKQAPVGNVATVPQAPVVEPVSPAAVEAEGVVEAPVIEAPPSVDREEEARKAREAFNAEAEKAVALLTRGKAEDARVAAATLEGLQAKAPGSAELAYNIGYAYELLDEIKKAEGYYRQATQLNPAFANAWLKLGQIYDEMGQHPRALALYREGIRRAPEAIELREAEVESLLRMERLAEAETAVRKALKVNANAVTLYANLALIYIDEGKLDLAKFILTKALNTIEGADNNAYLHAVLGRVYYLQEFFIDARESLELAVKLDPTLVPPRVYLSECYLDNRSYKKVVGVLEPARELDPTNVAVQMNLGIAYRGLDRLDEARKAYERVLSLDPLQTDAYLNIAVLEGDFNKEYTKAISILDAYRAQGGARVDVANEWSAYFAEQQADVVDTWASDYRRVARNLRRGKSLMITGKVDQGVQQYDDAFKKILKVAVESGGMSPTLQAEASGVDAQLKSLANSSAADIQRCVDLALASQYDTAIDSYVRVLQSIGSSVKRFSVVADAAVKASVLRGAPADSIDPKASGDAASAHLETIASMLSAARGVLATGDLQGAIARYKEAVDIGAQEEVIQPKIDSLEQSLKPAPPPPPPMAPPGEGSSPASGWGAPSPTVPSPSAAPAAGSAGWNAAPAQPAPAQPAPAQPVRVEVTPAPTPAAADEGFSIVPATTEWGAPAESASPAEPLPVEEEPEQDDEESEAPVPWGVETE